ncbi:S8 family serine peptidase [Streptomyces sp. CL12-4]|uniref:S8 family serine peptidase n=1 Tax=Streptomyces sp. CL12-4 TaxID=2810306 RepID=UPI001EFAA31C|nr:S8 family serine peptidase [Streptomyces sp. CL12-4]MCG8964752.1 S8 family serine peptidase [Streptomyces sp. CL12-4]
MKSATRRGLPVRAGSVIASALVAAGVGVAPSAAAADAQSEQWYLEPMQAETMWKASTGKGIKVAVIDTGVNPSTPSLRGQVLADEVPKQVAYGATKDYQGHGTSMAELIAGTGAEGGLQGLAPGAKIVPYRIVLTGVPEAEEKKTAEPAEAIKAAADTDAQIINMSFGGPYYDPAIEEAVTYAASKGKLLIAGVGNEGGGDEGDIGYPAAAPYVVGVSSMDRDANISKFSSRGNYVDLVAPGEDMPGYCRPSFESYCHGLEGTSASAAIASASAALIWSAHPDWTANQVTRALIDTASRKWPKNDPTQYAGYGTVRPRVVLENPNYDAGPAYSDPLAKWNKEKGKKLVTEVPPASAASPSATGSSQAPEGSSGAGKAAAGSKAEGTEKTENVAAESSTDDNSTLWIALGAAAAVVVLGGGAFVVLRSRRAT